MARTYSKTDLHTLFQRLKESGDDFICIECGDTKKKDSYLPSTCYCDWDE